MNRTERPRRWVAARSRPVLARLAGPRSRLAVAGRWVLARVDRFQHWMPDISRRGVLGLLLVAQLAWPAAFHSVSHAASQPAKAPVVSAPAPGTASPATPTAPTTPAAPAATGSAPAPAAKTPSRLPTPAQLMPEGMPTGQSTFIPTTVQMGNARAIIQTGQQLNLPPRAWVIAVATSLQETKLVNYGNLGDANDHDSLGLFQQRPSSGWGSPDQLTDPHYAATAFYRALVQVPGWQNLPLTVAAQDVQVSAFGDRYAQWEKQATDMVLAQYGVGPYWGVAAG
jgi:hypothetical protein